MSGRVLERRAERRDRSRIRRGWITAGAAVTVTCTTIAAVLTAAHMGIL